MFRGGKDLINESNDIKDMNVDSDNQTPKSIYIPLAFMDTFSFLSCVFLSLSKKSISLGVLGASFCKSRMEPQMSLCGAIVAIMGGGV